jgi:hypothetical protein
MDRIACRGPAVYRIDIQIPSTGDATRNDFSGRCDNTLVSTASAV